MLSNFSIRASSHSSPTQPSRLRPGPSRPWLAGTDQAVSRAEGLMQSGLSQESGCLKNKNRADEWPCGYLHEPLSGWYGLKRVNQRGTKSPLEAVRRSTIDTWLFQICRSKSEAWMRLASRFSMSKSGRSHKIGLPPNPSGDAQRASRMTAGPKRRSGSCLVCLVQSFSPVWLAWSREK